MAKQNPTSRLRSLLKKRKFIYMPAVVDPMGGRIAERLGFKAVYTGGYATGSSLTVTEPLLTMTEQVEIKQTGDYSGISKEDWIHTRQQIEDLCDLEEYYAVEENTVEKKKWGKR